MAWLKRRPAFWLALLVYLPLLLVLVRLRLFFPDVAVTVGIFFLLVIGLDLLFGYAGQLSLGHQAFFALGAYGVAILARFFGLSPWLAAAIALAVNVALAASLGRVLLRLSGLYFMLGTLAFGLIVEAVLRVWHPVTGGDQGIGNVPRPTLGGMPLNTDLAYGALAWLVAFVGFWFALNLAHSRLGRAMQAVRGDEVAAAANGVDVARIKINTFTLSVVYASLAGSLFASYIGTVHPDSFTLAALLEILLMLFLGGQGTIWGGLLGATLVLILPDLSSVFANYRILVNGLVFATVLFLLPDGLASGLQQLWRRVRRPGAAAPAPPQREIMLPRNGAGDGTHPPPVPTAAPLLAVEHQKRYFGGVRAVDDVSFTVQPGQIKSVIGPNGAGKSTLLNLLSGVDRAQAGRVHLLGQDVTALRADQIARLGVGRTFQNLRLFPDLTAIQNVMVGCYRRPQGTAGDILRVGLPLPAVRREEQALHARAREWLQLLGLDEYRDVAVRRLAYGHRKKVELARAAVAAPRLLLLDEPAAGLNDAEKDEFRAVIARLRVAGTTIVLIEHDMDFVMGLSDEVLVLNFGRVIADAVPAAVQRDEAVLQAYLGV